MFDAERVADTPTNPCRKTIARLLKDADCQNLQLNREFVGDVCKSFRWGFHDFDKG
jgi:hypothetical protein